MDTELVMIQEGSKARRAVEATIREMNYKRLVLETRLEEMEEARSQRIEELDTCLISVEERRMVLDQKRAEVEELKFQNALEERKATMEDRKAMIDVLGALVRKLW